MALILKKRKSFSRWYEKNKQRLSEQRKKRYAEDPAYRQRALEASRRRSRGELTVTTPPNEAPVSFGEAAERIGVGVSTLHEWRRKKYFPEPKRKNGRLWLTEQQVHLLLKLKEVIKVYGKRRGKVKPEKLKEVVTFIRANWQ